MLAQTERNIEIIAIDDGSRDASYEVVARMRDPRIRLYRNERNLGVSKTRNRGMELVRGDFLAPMDADDWCPPRRLEWTLAAMQGNPALGVCGGSTLWRGWGTVPFVGRQPVGPGAFRAYMLYGMPAQHDALLFRVSMLNEHRLCYNEKLRVSEDFDLLVRCLAVSDGDNVDRVVVHYYRNATGLSVNRTEADASHRLFLLRQSLEKLLPGRVDDCVIRRHAIIGNGTGARTQGELMEFRRWLEILNEANSERGVFDVAGLRIATAMIWFRCCRNSANLGGSAWQAWSQSPWVDAYPVAAAERIAFAGTWLMSRLMPSRRHPQGHFRGMIESGYGT